MSGSSEEEACSRHTLETKCQRSPFEESPNPQRDFTAKIRNGDGEQETMILNRGAGCVAKGANSQTAMERESNRRHVDVLSTELRLEDDEVKD